MKEANNIKYEQAKIILLSEVKIVAPHGYVGYYLGRHTKGLLRSGNASFLNVGTSYTDVFNL